uniref:Uncharacterized protein n=1 Tax=Oryza brachyantha TaxID=4533 RepID=J3KV17_ORYBR
MSRRGDVPSEHQRRPVWMAAGGGVACCLATTGVGGGADRVGGGGSTPGDDRRRRWRESRLSSSGAARFSPRCSASPSPPSLLAPLSVARLLLPPARSGDGRVGSTSYQRRSAGGIGSGGCRRWVKEAGDLEPAEATTAVRRRRGDDERSASESKCG